MDSEKYSYRTVKIILLKFFILIEIIPIDLSNDLSE